MPVGFASLVVVVVVAALAPICADLLPGRIRVPQVVLLLVAGVLVGPQVLELADPVPVEMLSSIGLGFLFLMAGYELDPKLLTASEGRLAFASWGTSVLAAFVLLAVLYSVDAASSPIVVSLALTTTALGTLLPILRDNQMLSGQFGRYMFAAGAVGEMAPIVAMSVFLGSQGSLVEIVALLVFLGLALLAARFPSLVRSSRIGHIIEVREHQTSQSTLRLAIALLFVLLWLADDLGFDSVLGAFVAGMVLRAWSPGDVKSLERKLDAVGYGFLIPVFFVYSGLTLDVDSLLHRPGALLLFAVVMLAFRGLPAMFWYRNRLPFAKRTELALLTATALPLLIALTTVGVESGHMTPQAQAIIVGAGVLSVLVFPIAAIEIHRKGEVPAPESTASGA